MEEVFGSGDDEVSGEPSGAARWSGVLTGTALRNISPRDAVMRSKEARRLDARVELSGRLRGATSRRLIVDGYSRNGTSFEGAKDRVADLKRSSIARWKM